MKNAIVGMAFLAATLLLTAEATAGSPAEPRKPTELDILLPSDDLAMPDLASSHKLNFDGLDLGKAHSLGHAEDPFAVELGENILFEPPWGTSKFDVQFRCTTQSDHNAWIKPAPLDQVFIHDSLGTQIESYSSLDEARLEAASRLPQNARHEAGFLLYERDDGSVGISEILSGSANALNPIKLASQAGRFVTRKGTHGVDGNYPVLEIIHSHPPHSTHFHSGGRGKGDIFVAESLGVNVSVVHGNRVHLYQPQGRSITRRFDSIKGDLVATLNDDYR